MATVEITSANLEATLTNNEIVLLDFWADWCNPCRQFSPIYEKVSDAHTDITFGKVDTEAEQQLAGAAGISAIPTLMIFREGIPVFSHSGLLPEAALEDLVSQVRKLDMADVRAKVAEMDQQAGVSSASADPND